MSVSSQSQEVAHLKPVGVFCITEQMFVPSHGKRPSQTPPHMCTSTPELKTSDSIKWDPQNIMQRQNSYARFYQWN